MPDNRVLEAYGRTTLMTDTHHIVRRRFTLQTVKADHLHCSARLYFAACHRRDDEHRQTLNTQRLSAHTPAQTRPHSRPNVVDHDVIYLSHHQHDLQ